MGDESDSSSENPGTPLDAAGVVRSRLQDALPDLEPLLLSTYGWTDSVVGFVHSLNEVPSGLKPLVTQIANDFLDLINDLCMGRGRPALRSSRSLYELLVTLHDITSSPEMAERYSRHEYVVAQQLATLDLGESLLSGKEGKAARHQKKKAVRDTLDGYNEALRSYGASFKRSWAPGDLRSRAKKHDLEDGYNFYGFASAILHGSSGGGVGLITEIGGEAVHRQGPALELCPIAYLYGISFFAAAVKRLGQELGGPSTDQVLEHLSFCLGAWIDYRRAIREIDRSLWPATADPTTVVPVLAIASVPRVRRWYLFNMRENLVCEAVQDGSIETEQAEMVEGLIEDYLESYPHSTELVTIVVVGAPVRARPGAKWQPAARVMAHRIFGDWRTVNLGSS